MNRRGFIGNLAAILAASTGPSILALEAFDRFKWKATDGGMVTVINPEWVNVEYEMQFIMDRHFYVPFYKFRAENPDRWPVAVDAQGLGRSAKGLKWNPRCLAARTIQSDVE
jgi:hypothetical protein